MVKKLLFIFPLIAFSHMSFAQSTFCDSSSNIVIYSNYDGGILNINVDQNIPNLKIGVCSYEAVQINISGTYAGNVTGVWYAGLIGTNDNCNLGITTTTISGVPPNVDTIQQYPVATLNDPNGSVQMICSYQCSNGNQGGCNTSQQVAHFFMTKFSGTTVRFHATQYNCWSVTQNISSGGNCCLIPVMTDLAVFESQMRVETFPNPADEQLTIKLHAEKAYSGQIRLTSILGETVLSQVYQSTRGENFFTLDVSGLSAGFYLLEFETPWGKETHKLEIQ
jgi:hypothetical protein